MKENGFVMDNKTEITQLKKSPMFQLSLSSKELFHSNMLAWIAEDQDTTDLFISILELFGLDSDKATELANGIRQGNYMVLREYKNFDFCICEKLRNWKENSDEEFVPGKVVLVLENKFKSIPYEAQLAEYESDVVKKLNPEGNINKVKSKYYEDNGKCINANSKEFKQLIKIMPNTTDCHFVLLTLCKDVCGLKVVNDKFGNWHVISYKEYAEKLLEDKPKDFKHEIILDYAGYVNKFCDYIYSKLSNLTPTVLLDENWNKVFCSDPDLRAIRMDDIWQKLVANIVLKQLRKKGVGILVGDDDSKYVVGIKAEDFLKNYKKGDVLVGAGYSRGTALIEIKIHVGDECLFGVQIQDGLYKRFFEASKVKVEKDETERKSFYKVRLEKFKKNNLFRYEKFCWEPEEVIFTNEDVCPNENNVGKAGLQGFGGYGTTFLAQWKKINDTATVDDVLLQIIEDCKKVM